jgi:carboxypeptidase T
MSSIRAALLLSIALLLALLALQPSPTDASAPATQPPAPDWDPACYSTYPQIETFLQAKASQYPNIASLIDGGLAWEGSRHLYALRLGSNRLPGPKPAIFLIGGHHPRDIATTEMLLRLVTYLTQSYGSDPDTTWLLDNRTVVVLPLANPDGYYQVYANGLNQFKNRNNTYCAGSNDRGADINRNYPFQWNTIGTSSQPCDSSYPGSAALSEPESNAVLSLLTGMGTDLLLNLQAPGSRILYPWGYTPTPPADASGLYALGWAMARRNGTPSSEVRTHNSYLPISGTIDDTAYSMGIPGMTLNIGPNLSPTCSELDLLWPAQRPAFLHALKAAGLTAPTTLSRSFGPDITGLSVSHPAPDSVQVSGVLSSNYGTVAGAVYYLDDPGTDGSGTPIPGDFGGGTAVVSATVDTASLPTGRHLLLLQGVNNSGQWGVLSSVFFTVTNPPPATPSATPSPTRTTTLATTHTPAVAPTASLTSTSTASTTSTSVPSSTPTPTVTSTYTPSPTASRTATITRTATSTPTTISDTRTHTPTRTPTVPTATPTHTSTQTPSRTLTSTRTPTHTRTSTLTRTVTSTRTPTNTYAPTDTRTPTYTRTTTPTRTPTNSRTPAPPNTPTPLPCVTFSDVYPSQYFYQAVNWLVCRSIVSGYPDNTFRPSNPASRAQIMKMVVLGHAWPLCTQVTSDEYQVTSSSLTPLVTRYSSLGPSPCGQHFSDVLPGAWHYPYVETALLHAIISGYPDGTFRPSDNVTRGQLSKIIVSASSWPLLTPPSPSFTDVPPASTFYPYIETARYHAVVSGYGDGTFRPSLPASRGQLSKMLYIALTGIRDQGLGIRDQPLAHSPTLGPNPEPFNPRSLTPDP